MDAEDCVQEAFLQWYASEEKETIEHPKAYLSTLVTRRCIDRLRSAQAQRETYVGLWLPEPLVETTDPSERWDLNESLSGVSPAAGTPGSPSPHRSGYR